MTTTIYLSDDGWYMTETEARVVSPGCTLPSSVRVMRKVTATFVAETKPTLEAQELFRTFLPVAIEIVRQDFDEEDVAIEVGRRVRHWEGQE